MAEIVHDPAARRYRLLIDGEELGYLDYEADTGWVDLAHTVVDPSLRGSGLGAKLVQFALDDLAANSTDRVVAGCPFVASYIARNPQYAPLLTR